MAKQGKKRLLDYLKVDNSYNDDDEYDDDDMFDDDDDYDEYDDYDAEEDSAFVAPKKQKTPKATKAPKTAKNSYSSSSYSGGNTAYQTAPKRSVQNENVVAFDAPPRRRPITNEVYVIKPQVLDDAQTVVDSLRSGKTIVINMEGVSLDPAQRIIDFICGACYGIQGELKAISSNIFIAAPNNIEITGALREELIGDSSLSPHLG